MESKLAPPGEIQRPVPSTVPHTILWALACVAVLVTLFFLGVWIGWPQALLMPVGVLFWGDDAIPGMALANLVLAYPFTWASSAPVRRSAWRLVAVLDVVLVLAIAGWELWVLIFLPAAGWLARSAWRISNSET